MKGVTSIRDFYTMDNLVEKTMFVYVRPIAQRYVFKIARKFRIGSNIKT